MKDLQLSRNFNLSEFIESDTAEEKGIDNTPPDWAIENITLLVIKLLQPLRSLYCRPLHINSGYRSKALNIAVHGEATSQHLKGQAADVRCDNPKQLYSLLKASNLDFDECGIYSTFLHLSYKPTGNQREVWYGKY